MGFRFFPLLGLLILTFFMPTSVQAQGPLRIVALGDSLTAGYGLPAGEDFASKLQSALISDGYSVRIDNAGISGNTTQQGLARLPQAIGGAKPDLVILALGANDMLRKFDVSVPRKNLSDMLAVLKAQAIPVLLVGIHKPSSQFFLFSDPYKEMFAELADEYDVQLYPFFLKGVALKGELNLADGIHPNVKGVDVMVENILPAVKKALKN